MANGFVLGINLQIQKVLGLDVVKQQLAGISVGKGTGQPLQQTQNQLDNIASSASSIQAPMDNASRSIQDLGKKSSRATRNVGATSSALDAGANSAQNFGEQVFLAGRRYGAFIAATTVAFKGIELIGAGTEAVIGFDQAVVQLGQILGRTPDQIGDLTQQMLDLSVETGTAALEIARVTRVLAQAGFEGAQLEEAMQQLAKVPLTPTFDNVDEAIVGVIAALKQFKDEGLTATDVLDKLTAVERDFAASSKDIAIGIARGGSAFETIGGTLDEFIAAFTVIKDVTQESASSVGVALKTISSRLASPEILKFLESRGINLVEEGQFVGPLEAFRRIGEALEDVVAVQDKLDIGNKLGGRRQISRLAALLKNIDQLNLALDLSKNSSNAFADTAEKGLEAIRVKINQLVANAKKLAIELGPEVFIPFIEGLTSAGNAAVELLRVLKPLLPIVSQIGAVFAAGGLALAGRSLGAAVLQRTAPFKAAAATGAGAVGAGAFVAGSPFAQAGLLVAAGQLSSSFLRLADGSDSLIASFVSAFTTLTAAVTLFRGQTLSQFVAGGGLLPTLGKFGGALVTGAALAAPILISQSKKAVEDTANKIIDSAIETVNNIDISPQDISPENTRQLRNAFVSLNNLLANSLSDFIDSFDPFAQDIGLGESVSRTLAGAGRAISGIFSGDPERLVRPGGLSTQDIQQQISKIFEANKQLVNNLIDSFARSLTDASAIDPQALPRKLFQQISSAGISQESTILLTDKIIEAAGGVKSFTEKVIESTKAIQEQTESTRKLSDFTKQFVAPGLTGQLFNFDRAFKSTIQTLQSSANSFRNQFSLISGIGTGAIGGNFGPESIRRSIIGGSFGNLFQDVPGIPKFIGGIGDIKNVLNDFINFVSERSDTLKSEDIDAQLDVFFRFRNNVPKAIQDNFREVLTEVGRLMADSAATDVPLEQVRKRFGDALQKFGSDLSDTVVEQVGQLAELSLSRIERNLDAFANIQKLRLETAVMPTTQVNLLRDLLQEVGISVRGIGGGPSATRGTLRDLQEEKRRQGLFVTPEAPTGFFTGGANRALIEAVTGGPAREELRRKFLELTRSVSETRGELSALDFGSQQFEDVSAKLQNLSKELIRVQTAFGALDQATNRARQTRLEEARSESELKLLRFREETQRLQALGAGVNVEARRREEFNLESQIAQEQRQINEEFDKIIEQDARARLDAAIIIEQNTRDQRTTTQIFQSSVDAFSQAVINFKTFSEETQDPAALQELGGLLGQGVLDEATATRFLDRVVNAGGIDNTSRQQEEIQRGINESNANNQNGQQQIIGTLENIAGSTNANAEISKNIEKSLSNIQPSQEIISPELQDIFDKIKNISERLNIEERKLIIDTDQRIEIDITGITDTIKGEIEPLLKNAADKAAKSVITDILRSMANRSNDPEAATIFGQIGTELESNG